MDQQVRNLASATRLAEQLAELGVEPGGVLVVHTAFSRVRPVAGGPVGLIHALRAALGARGTLVMPSMSDDDEHPFDVRRTPCDGMGVVADTFWRMPGVSRSDSPHAFAAIGPLAAVITAPHPPDVPHGLDSPIGRIWQRDGEVLLLGVGHDANTTIHLAENMAAVRYGQAKFLTVWSESRQAVRLNYFEVDHCCANFARMDDWLDGANLQRRGQVGSASARLARCRDVVSVALAALRDNETVFLHPRGQCEECDAARLQSRRN